jgi:hypothetical protein
MAKAELTCWKCSESLADVLLPFARLSKCKSCKTDLHVCRMCLYFDPAVSNSCREPIAEKVNDKNRANFCGYFQPAENACKSGDDAVSSSKASLESLFGIGQGSTKLSTSDADQAKNELDALFGLDDRQQD